MNALTAGSVRDSSVTRVVLRFLAAMKPPRDDGGEHTFANGVSKWRRERSARTFARGLPAHARPCSSNVVARRLPHPIERHRRFLSSARPVTLARLARGRLALE